MSGLMPFEGSGESSLAPLEPSTTVVSYYEIPRTTVASYPGSSFKTTTTNTHRVPSTVWLTPTTYTLTTIGGTEDHQSTKSIPYLLPLWTWAALLLGIVVLVSLTTILITLVVGWKKGKRRKRRDSEVNLNPRSTSSRRNSNLWIDENDGQGQPVEGTRTHKASTSLTLPGGNSSTSNVGAGFPNVMYVKQHNDILKEMKAKSSLFLNERAGDSGTWSDCETRRDEIDNIMHTRGDRQRYETRDNKRVDVMATRVHKGHQDKPQYSQTLPRSLHSHNVTDARLSHRLIHLQPATTSTFKRPTAGKKHARHDNIINEHTTDTQYHGTSDPAQIGDTATNYDILERRVNTCASGDPEFEMNLDLTIGPSLGVEEVADMNPFNYQNNPVDRDSPARGLELSGNVHVLEPQININPLPPAPSMNRHDFDNYDVTTFSQYAFSTL